MLFGSNRKGILGFSSGNHERKLLEKVGDSFSFPIMEEDLGKEGLDKVLTLTKDLSLKSFVACRVAERSLAAERKDLRLKCQNYQWCS